jgi:hypothetical protein
MPPLGGPLDDENEPDDEDRARGDGTAVSEGNHQAAALVRPLARQSTSGQMGAVLCWRARMRSLLAGEGGGEVLGEEMGDCFKNSKLIMAHTKKRRKKRGTH